MDQCVECTAMAKERKGRPKVFDNYEVLLGILENHKPANSRHGWWTYAASGEDATDLKAIDTLKPVMQDLAKHQSDLRLSFPVLEKAVKTASGYKCKEKAGIEALKLITACKHWLRDIKRDCEWTTTFGTLCVYIYIYIYTYTCVCV